MYQKKKKDENLNETYHVMKEDFLLLTNNIKDNKKLLFKPGPVSSSQIISRCIGYNKKMLEIDEENRLQSALNNLKNAINSKEQIEVPQIDDENISKIINEVSKLNDLLKKRNEELIYRSDISSEIINHVNDVENQSDDVLQYIENEIVNEEMKRRHFEDMKFDDELEELISTGVLDLLASVYDEDSDVSLKYPFLSEIASIVNNYLLQSKKKYFGDLQEVVIETSANINPSFI